MEEEIREEEAAELQAEEAEMMARLQEEIRNLPVSDHLLYMMHSLSALAVGRMGVTAETAVTRDLDQARLAIDAFKALMEVVEKTRPAEEMAVHRGMLAQLQLAYVAALEPCAAEEAAAQEATAQEAEAEEAGADAGEPDAHAPADGADGTEDADESAEQVGEAAPPAGEAAPPLGEPSPEAGETS